MAHQIKIFRGPDIITADVLFGKIAEVADRTAFEQVLVSEIPISCRGIFLLLLLSGFFLILKSFSIIFMKDLLCSGAE